MTPLTPPPPPPALQPFKTLIKNRCGLMFDGIGEDNLLAALDIRCRASNRPTLEAYYALLTSNVSEFNELVSHLTINETYFYRESRQIELMIEHLLPALLRDKALGQPVRILSAGCSTGEEPYSLAIALLEHYGDNARHLFTLYGGDIDWRALEKARQARYGSFSFRGLPLPLQQKYFTALDRQTFVLAEGVRRMVQFHPLNLLDEAVMPPLCDMDIIFLRNVSIYFDRETRQVIQQNLHRRLADGKGFLIVGLTETLANDLGVFRLTEHDGQFFFASGAGHFPEARAGSLPGLPWQSLPPAPPAPALPSSGLSSSGLLPSGLSLPVLSALDSPLLPLEEAPGTQDSLPASLSTGGRLLPLPADEPFFPAPSGSASREEQEKAATGPVLDLVGEQRWEEARSAALRLPDSNRLRLPLLGWISLQLRDFEAASDWAARACLQDPWSLEALVVRGFAARWLGDAASAIQWLKKALYVRPDCWVAQYYLGDLYRSIDQHDLARRSWRLALNGLEAPAPLADGGLAFPLGLPLTHIRFLCQRYLTQPLAGEG